MTDFRRETVSFIFQSASLAVAVPVALALTGPWEGGFVTQVVHWVVGVVTTILVALLIYTPAFHKYEEWWEKRNIK